MSPSQTWRDAHALYRSFRSIRYGTPSHRLAWTEVRDSCRRSRRFRRWWLRTCRENPFFRARLDWLA